MGLQVVILINSQSLHLVESYNLQKVWEAEPKKVIIYEVTGSEVDSVRVRRFLNTINLFTLFGFLHNANVLHIFKI